MSLPKPTIEQQQAANPAQSVWVSASAGTGKTRVLVTRLLRLLLAGTAPEKILCITFTKAAAAEVLERAQHTVLKWSVQNEKELKADLEDILDHAPQSHEIQRARRLLPLILQSPGGMKIMTIHAFCQSVLARFPLEAKITPGFTIIDESQSQGLLTQAKHQLLEDTTPQNDPELFNNLTRFFDRLDEKNQNSIIQNVLLKRYRLDELFADRDFHEVKNTICSVIGISLDDLTLDYKTQFIQSTPIEQIRTLIPELQQGTGVRPVNRADSLITWLDQQNNIDLYTGVFLTKEKAIAKTLMDGLKKAPAWVTELLEKEAQRSEAHYQFENKINLAKDTIALLHICTKLIAYYNDLKKLHGVLDYEDQILLTSKLLKNPTDSLWVHYKLDGGIDHILVDEAQDTSPAQWDIIKGITSDFFNGNSRREIGERSLFIVGDEKQSIFSFQNADPVAFSNARNTFAEQANLSKAPWQDIALIDNFRSAPLVLQMTDQVFADPKLASYISHLDHHIRHQAFHATRPGKIDLWPLVPQPENDAYTSSSEFILADAIASQAQQLIGTRLSNGSLVRPGDIMILVRKRNPLVGPLTKAFKDRSIPVTSSDRLVLKDQLAVQDCLIAIQASLHPTNDYALACFLKSPFIGMNEDSLYHLAVNRKTSLWENLVASSYKNIVDYISGLSESAAISSPGNFIHSLLSQPCPADSHSGRHILVKRLGYDCDDVLDELLLTAYQFEENYDSGTLCFVTWMQNNQSVIKRSNSELDKSRVQIMTVHASKGLQAPIVFLADASSKPERYNAVREVIWNDNPKNGFLWGMGDSKQSPAFIAEKDRYTELKFSEYYRLLYVAMTRAEEKLVICGWQRKTQTHTEYPSWYESIAAAVQQLSTHSLYQSQENRHFGQTGLQLLQQGQVKEANDKKPDIVEKKAVPVELLSKPPQEIQAIRPLRPSRPTEQEPAVFSPLQPARNDPYKRGQLLHTLFRLIPDYPPEEQDEALENLLHHHVDNEKERQALATEVMKVLRHPEFAHLFTPNAKSEVPIVGEIELDGKNFALSGQIDRLLIEKDRVLIVDYKTNRPPVLEEDKIPAAYRYQLRAYKAVMQKIYPDKKIETALLWTSIPYLLPVSS